MRQKKKQREIPLPELIGYDDRSLTAFDLHGKVSACATGGLGEGGSAADNFYSGAVQRGRARAARDRHTAQAATAGDGKSHKRRAARPDIGFAHPRDFTHDFAGIVAGFGISGGLLFPACSTRNRLAFFRTAGGACFGIAFCVPLFGLGFLGLLRLCLFLLFRLWFWLWFGL